MLQAMLAGVASIKAQQTRMNVIGNNLANINTTAFKSSRVSFEDMIAQTVRGATGATTNLGGIDPTQFGLGVTVSGTDTNNEQGSLAATNRPTDLAIQGFGYFMVSNGQGISYTRDGNFDLDQNGDIVNRSTGQRLLGWAADAQGNVDTSAPVEAAPGVSTLNIPVGVLNSVQSTTKASFGGNLSSTAASTDSLVTQITVYDSLGNAHNISIKFTNRTAPPAAGAPAGSASSWDWQAFEGTVASGTPIGDSSTAGNQALYFDNAGQLVNPNGTFDFTVPASSGGVATPISLDLSKISQLSADSQVSPTGQNGYPPGSLASFSIGADGLITGVFTNGLSRTLGQIAMAVFPNPGGLERIGNNLWQKSDNSGLPVVSLPRNGSAGTLSAGFLEQSNVDIGNEFSDLIVTQRGFQANTKVVTTVDEMMQDLINMKR